MRTFIGWSQDVMKQLEEGQRQRFQVIPTLHFACDRRVITFLSNRTLGNSPTLLRNCLSELYTEEWMRCVGTYLTDCERYKKGAAGRYVGSRLN